ncbi:hypothetical protein HK101_009546 [Irineochytrium annulatum]|nr:hypothetical protein HK101_009546 [Irineochytrium annulatum]
MSLNGNKLGVLDILAIVLGPIFSCLTGYWYAGLASGYGYHLVFYAFTSVWFVAFCVILCELMTALPFAGGLSTYARYMIPNMLGGVTNLHMSASSLCRAAFGPYIGYLVGQSELSEYTLYGASDITYAATLFSEATNLSTVYNPYVWSFACVGCFALQLMSSRIGLVAPAIDFNKWAVVDFYENMFNTTFIDNTTVGIAANNDALASNLTLPAFSVATALFPTGLWAAVVNCLPNQDGPLALFIAAIILLVQLTLFVVVFPLVPPGAYALSNTSMGPNVDPIIAIYNITETSPAYQGLNILGNFSTFTAAVSLTFAFARLAFALARGGSMPNFMAWSRVPLKRERVPWFACIFGVGVTVVTSLISYLEDGTIDSILSTAGTISQQAVEVEYWAGVRSLYVILTYWRMY